MIFSRGEEVQSHGMADLRVGVSDVLG